jgi:hypothetical protein
MERMTMDVNTIRAYARGGGGQDEALKAARELVDWSTRLRDLFPPAMVVALYVNMTSEMARSAPEAMRHTAHRLASAVSTGNRDQVTQQLAITESEGCGACHRRGYP